MENTVVTFLCLYRVTYSSASSVADKANTYGKSFDPLDISSLPNYVVANVSNLQAIRDSSIRKKASALTFPLSEQDKRDIETLELKFDNEKDCAGLAAPQIGISKRAIVFKVDEEEGVEGFPRSVWINPTYEKASDDTEVAYEQCFSVQGVTAPVRRFRCINYKAQDVSGNIIQGRAEGFSARVIQHETDHLNGILFIDLVPKEKIITLQEFKRILKNYEEEEARRKKAS